MSTRKSQYEMIDLEVLYPSRNNNPGYSYSYYTPFGEITTEGRIHELMCSVLWRAFLDLKSPHLVAGSSARYVWLTARDFFLSDETGISELNFTFLGICDELGIEPAPILELCRPHMADSCCPQHFQPWGKTKRRLPVYGLEERRAA